MPAKKAVDPQELRDSVAAVAGWLDDEAVTDPGRSALAAAVRLSVRTLAQIAPGHSVEVRVPPFAAVQCIVGPRHTRGTPPNVVETDPRTWLLLATGRTSFRQAIDDGRVDVSGSRAGDVAGYLPLVRV